MRQLFKPTTTYRVSNKQTTTLVEENSMESRIQKLIVKTGLSDATTCTLQQELHEARTNVNKLTAQ